MKSSNISTFSNFSSDFDQSTYNIILFCQLSNVLDMFNIHLLTKLIGNIVINFHALYSDNPAGNFPSILR